MSDVTPIRPEDEFNPAASTDPLENLLDEESDEDFGYVVTRDRATGPDGHPVKLADWSAQDFASIYTRFRPHLERHARRFLNNPSQVDEVVQDAFLYLMVSLPELDSEIGVLRFLKWKTRLLCLDVIRASGKAYVSNIDDVAEPMSQDPEVSSYLEQQDDAAVLRLALSKLNPRHREVLLASIYEEKSTEQIAAQVGLSENATRQLIFRARSAFKKALLGDDVNTEGMSAAAILSVAARKAAHEAKKVGAQAMVFALFLMLAIGAFVNFTGRGTQTQQLAESQAPTQSQAPETQTSESQAPSESVQTPAKAPNAGEAEIVAAPVAQVSKPSASPSASASPFSQAELAQLFDTAPEETLIFKAAKLSKDVYDRQGYTVASSNGVIADFSFAAEESSPFTDVMFTFDIDGKRLYAYPDKFDLVVATDKKGLEHYVFYGSLKYLFDDEGIVWDKSKLAKATARLELVVNPMLRTLDKSTLTVLED
jgi:RNA polymerase sigma-70 factor (ECF subfamily)